MAHAEARRSRRKNLKKIKMSFLFLFFLSASLRLGVSA